MADHNQLDRIEALLLASAKKQTRIELEQQQQTGLLTSLIAGARIMITVEDLAAQLDAATTAEAAALAAQSTQIDAVQAEIQSLFDRLPAGTPQAVLDSLAASLTKLGGTQAALAAQSARLTAMAVDPSNPVPTPAPVA